MLLRFVQLSIYTRKLNKYIFLSLQVQQAFSGHQKNACWTDFLKAAWGFATYENVSLISHFNLFCGSWSCKTQERKLKSEIKKILRFQQITQFLKCSINTQHPKLYQFFILIFASQTTNLHKYLWHTMRYKDSTLRMVAHGKSLVRKLACNLHESLYLDLDLVSLKDSY